MSAGQVFESIVFVSTISDLRFSLFSFQEFSSLSEKFIDHEKKNKYHVSCESLECICLVAKEAHKDKNRGFTVVIKVGTRM